MIQRREFLAGLFVAPAIVHAENMMKIWVPKKKIVRATVYGFSPGEIAEIKAGFERINPGTELIVTAFQQANGQYAELIQ